MSKVQQKYGIKYPFTLKNNDNLYIDLSETIKDEVTSKVLHVLFTPKGQRLRMPKFGTDLIKYIFQPSDEITYNDLVSEIKEDIKRYVPEVDFEDVKVVEDELNENGRIVLVTYSITKGNKKETITTGVKLS